MISLLIAEYTGLFIILSVTFVYIFPRLKDNVINNLIKAVIMFVVIVLFNILLKQNKDGFYFELTPEKHCDGGPYMWSSSPEKKALCSKFSKQDLSRYNCPVGYHGRPVWWGGNTPDSNANWKNTRCNNLDSSVPDPQVL